MKKKILIGIAVLVVAFVGPVVAWQLVDDEPRRQGVLTTSAAPVSGWHVVENDHQVGRLQAKHVWVECPPDKKVFGGGFWVSGSLGVEINAPATARVHGGVPSRAGRAWQVKLWNGTINVHNLTAFAICADAS